MSVEEPNTIDAIGVESATGKVVLTISDHLDWEPPGPHMMALQEKLNTYLRFVESGEFTEVYPDAASRSVVFDVVMRVPPNAAGRAFLERVRVIIRAAGLDLRDRVLEARH